MISDEPEFNVTHLPSVRGQLRSILDQATDPHERQQLIQIVKATWDGLRATPFQWGDPLYRTRKEGGLVFGRVVWPLTITYVAYELERVVCVLSIEKIASENPT